MSKDGLRILIINYEFPPLGGGGASVTQELAAGLVSKGLDVDVVTMGYKGLPDYEVIDGINVYRVKCIRKHLEICRTHEMLSYVISCIFFLRGFLKKEEYDICHCHFIIPSGIIAAWLKRKYGIKYIITAHGSDVPGYNPDRFTLQHKFTGPLIKRICDNAETITTPSGYLSNLLKKNIRDYNVKVIPNGSRDYKIEGIKKENIIMTSGRLLPRKGYHLLINSFRRMNADGWELYIVGDGPERATLERIAGDDNKIIFTGWLDNTEREYCEIMNRAKIFSLLSTVESQGIVFIEAMSCGCAIISTNYTACVETVTEDVGYRVNTDEEENVTDALVRLISKDAHIQELSKNARKRYQDNYRYEMIVEKYISLFREYSE